jgi:hypothetical protein
MKTNQSIKNVAIAAAFGIATLLSPVANAAGEINGGFTLAMASSEYAPASVNVMEQRWEAVQQAARPDQMVKLGEAFAKDFPNSKHGDANKSLIEGARKSQTAFRAARLSADAIEDASGNDVYRNELTSALRGDRTGARRVALMYRDGTNGLSANAHRAQQWLQVASELGCGVSSWQVAEMFNSAGQIAEAAKFEAKAIAIGYRLPARLPTKSMNI